MTIVEPVAASRITTMDEEARAAGFSPVQPWFAAGTQLLDIGRDRYQESRVGYDQMPEAGDVLPQFVNDILEEVRQDIHVVGRDLTMREDGRLCWANRAMHLTPASFARLVDHVLDRGVPRPTGYWLSLPPERRAPAFNDAAFRSQRPFNLRVRTVHGEPEVFAVTSRRYAPVDNWRIVRRLQELVDPKTKTRLVYAGTRTSIDFVFHADIPVEGVAVGEFFKSAINYTTDDDGTESIRNRVRLWRALCINFTTAEMSQSLLRRRHVGDVDGILQQIVASTAASQQKLAWFVERYNQVSHSDMRNDITVRHADGWTLAGRQWDWATPKPLLESLFDTWKIPGVTAAAIAEAAEQAWFTELPDWSPRGISNAVTRAAHQSRWPSERIVSALEDVGGRLIMEDRLPELVYVEA